MELATHRYVAEDLTLAGHHIPRGSVVSVALSSASRGAPRRRANRTPPNWTSPPAPRHLSFGHGIHHCLGAPLARLEATRALGTLLRRFPLLEAAVPLEDLAWIPSGMMRGPVGLPVRYAAASG
ncbi:cytochrome P450 [Streptomyces sp. M19]